MPKIYTKVGDKGQTALVGGQKVSKANPRLEAYGTIDELNCVLGLARLVTERVTREKAGVGLVATPKSFDSLMRLCGDLETIQHWLFDLGSLLASEQADRDKYQLPPMTAAHITWLEDRIDGASELLEPLRNFILPGGTEPAAHLHIARTVARRAERSMVAMGDDCPEQAIPFINRLSDYLFTMARLCNSVLKASDTEWKKTLPPS